MIELIFNNLKQGYRTSYLFHFAIIFFSRYLELCHPESHTHTDITDADKHTESQYVRSLTAYLGFISS